MTTRLIAGCMTGTSLDGLDAALVEIEGRGLQMSARCVRGVSRPLGGLGGRLREMTRGEPISASAAAELARDLAGAHVEALRECLGGARPDLVCVHGQTVCHAPPISWQLLNPWPICRSLHVPVVFDLRGADLAEGGQGAPITPMADLVLFGDAERSRAVVNLGGFCNVTVLPATRGRTGDAAAEIEGRDVCACNHVLDGLARALLDLPFDESGRRARTGRVQEKLTTELAGLLIAQSSAGRSLGTGDEFAAWTEQARRKGSSEDVLRSACDGLGRVIASAVMGADDVVLAGGGTRNAVLVRAISDHLGQAATTTDELGVPAEFREAACMAVLGALCQDRTPITLSRVTGVRAPAPPAGCWAYP
jgi:anhydro-N-acetylmuramic acid kinase